MSRKKSNDYGFYIKYLNFVIDKKYLPFDLYSIGNLVLLVLPENHYFDMFGNLYNTLIRDISKNFDKIILLIESTKFGDGTNRLRGLEDLIKEGKIEVVDIFKDLHSGDPSKLYMRLYDAIKKEAGDLIIIKAGIGHLPEIYSAINLVIDRYIADLSFEKMKEKNNVNKYEGYNRTRMGP